MNISQKTKTFIPETSAPVAKVTGANLSENQLVGANGGESEEEILAFADRAWSQTSSEISAHRSGAER